METLDLHGVKHADVELMVEDFILRYDPPFMIITGNSPAMKNMVMKLLKQYNFKYKYPHEHNLGSLIIYA